MRQLLAKTLVVCVVLVSTAGAQDRFEGLDKYVEEGREKWKVPGLAIAVVKDGKTVLVRSYGVMQLGHPDKVTEETLFPIASCTKTFTACCIAMLVDEGKLNLDDRVRQHLPDFRVADPYVTEHVTIRDLLCHRTGLVRGDLLGMSGGFTHAEMLNQIQFLPQAVPFRTKVTYNNLMYAVLGEIIARKSGLTWQEFVEARILKPLEMKSTTANRVSFTEPVARRHRIYDGTLAPLKTRDTDSMPAAGAIHATAGDMAKWMNFQLREGESDGTQLVSKSVLREMHALQQSIPVKWKPESDEYDARFAGAGLGWFVRDYRGRKVVQHGGAWGAEFAFVPEEKLGIVVLSNRDWNGLTWMLIFDVIDAYVVGPEQAWARGKKWERWLKLGGPDAMNRDQIEQRTELEQNRKTGTQPTLPLTAYAGTYQSKLYSDLQVHVVDGRLGVKFGDYSATLDHWDDDTFYGHAVIEPFLDWHVKFDLDDQRTVRGLEFINIGWKGADERFLFTRRIK